MTSKAERKRRKRVVLMGGRPRIEGPREPNGRPSRKEAAQSAVKTASEARQRLFGLPESIARLPEAMTVLGRMRLVGSLSAEQYDAGIGYQELRVRYQRAIGAPVDYAEPAPDVWDRSGMDFGEWVVATKAQHAAMMEALTDLCVEVRSPAPKAAIEVIINRDIDMPELTGALRLALNRLERHFGGRKLKCA